MGIAFPSMVRSRACIRLTEVSSGSRNISSICLGVVKPALSISLATAPPTPRRRPMRSATAMYWVLRG